MTFQFYKYQATGNDFILIDDREKHFDATNSSLIRRLCNRRLQFCFVCNGATCQADTNTGERSSSTRACCPIRVNISVEIRGRMRRSFVWQKIGWAASHSWEGRLWKGLLELLSPEVNTIVSSCVEVFHNMPETMVVYFMWVNRGLGTLDDSVG